MAIQLEKDSNGIVTRIVQNNPGGRLDIPVPNQKELIRLGATDESLGTQELAFFNNNQLIRLGTPTGKGNNLQAQSDLISQLGIDFGSLRQFNPSDLIGHGDRGLSYSDISSDEFNNLFNTFGVNVGQGNSAATQVGNFLPISQIPLADLITPLDTAKNNLLARNGNSGFNIAGFKEDGNVGVNLTDLQNKVLNTDPGLKANKDYINGVFKAFHNRDATAEELANFVGQSVDRARRTIIGGSPIINQLPANIKDEFKNGDTISAAILDSTGSQLNASNFPEDQSSATNQMFLKALDGVDNNLTKIIGRLIAEKKDLVDKEKADLQAEKDELKARVNDLTTSNTQQNAFNAYLKKFDVENKIDKLTNVQEKMANLKGSIEQGINQTSDQLAPLGLITRRQQRLLDQGNAQMSTLAALAGVYMDDLNISKQFIEMGMNAVTNDQNVRISALNTLLELNNQDLIDITAEEKNLFESQIALLQDEVENKREQASLVADLITAYPDAALDGGVSIDDDYRSAVQKMMPALAKIAKDNKIKENSFEIKKIGVDKNGEDVYGVFNPITGEINPVNESDLNLPAIQTTIDTPFGSQGVITGYGSPYWAEGLDIVLQGGQNADIVIPFDFEVISTGVEGGFGNRVRIKNVTDGQEIFFGHMSKIALAPGTYSAGTSIGKQGNSGSVIPSPGGDGTHIDITMPDMTGSGYKTAYEVASYLGLSGDTSVGGIGGEAKGTQAQFTAAGFANRIIQANEIIDTIGDQFVKNSALIGQSLPNIFQTADRQRFEQAKRNFINAVLRRESGAAIAPSEFESADKQYFPQAGDSSEVLEQKKQNRQTVQQSLISEAGTAFVPTINDTSKDPLGVTMDKNNPLGINLN